MKTLRTVFWLRRRLAIRGLTSIAGATNLVAGLALALLAALGALALAIGLGVVLHLASISTDQDAIQLGWTVALYTIGFFAVIVPIITGAGSSAFDPSRLLIFPVSRKSLHRLALGSEFLSASHLVWYPALLASAVTGILLPGPHRLAQLAVIGLFGFLLVVWSQAASLVARRWLRNRKLRELAAVIGLVLVVVLSVAPAAVDITAENADQRIEEFLTIPPWIEKVSEFLPPSIASQALTAQRTGRTGTAFMQAGWLVIWLLAGLFIGRAAFDALLATGGETEKHSDRSQEYRPITTRTRILDRLPSPVGAVADKELRYLLQSGTGRTSLLVMPVMTALPALLAGRHDGMMVFGLDLQLAVFLGVMIYATALTGYLQVNAFAWEKTGIASYFTAPVRPEEILLGKNLGIWILNLALGLEGVVVFSMVQGIPDITTVFTGLIVLGSMSVLLSMMGNFTSVAFPESRPVSSLTSSASPTGTLMMIGCLLLGVILAGIVVFGAALLKVPALQPILALVIFAVVVGAYRLTLSPAARTFSDRRDDVFHALGAG